MNSLKTILFSLMLTASTFAFSQEGGTHKVEIIEADASGWSNLVGDAGPNLENWIQQGVDLAVQTATIAYQAANPNAESVNVSVDPDHEPTYEWRTWPNGDPYLYVTVRVIATIVTPNQTLPK